MKRWLVMRLRLAPELEPEKRKLNSIAGYLMSVFADMESRADHHQNEEMFRKRAMILHDAKLTKKWKNWPLTRQQRDVLEGLVADTSGKLGVLALSTVDHEPPARHMVMLRDILKEM